MTDGFSDQYGPIPEHQPPIVQAAPKDGYEDQYGPLVADPHERGRAALNGLTFGLGPRIMATGRSMMGENYEAAKADEYSKLDAYKQAHPWEALGYEAVGSAPSFLIPGVGEALGTARVAKAADLARTGTVAAQGLSTSARAARLAGLGADVGSVGHEVGVMGAKAAAVNAALYDPTDWTDPLHHAAEAVKAIPLGYIGGRVINRVGSAVGDTVGNIAEAMQVGSGAKAAALNEIRTRMDESGRTVDDARAELLPQGLTKTIGEDHKSTIVSSYHDALAAGGTERQARLAALADYQAMNPLNARGEPLGAKTALSHVGEVVDAYQDMNTVPLLASEVLHGVDNTAKGGVASLTAEVMNSATGGREALASAALDRQEGAIGRTRDLIKTEFGRPDEGHVDPVTGKPVKNLPPYDVQDYTGTMRDIQDNSRAMSDQLYGWAKTNAKPFNLGGIIDGFDRRAQTMFGNPGRALSGAVNDMSDWWSKMQGQPPAILLNSYRQARGALTEDIIKLRKDGQRESAAQLQHMKTVMDRVVANKNPDWWHANNRTAASFRIDEAADRGRTLPLKEGAAAQEAKDWAQNATSPERDAYRVGLGRRLLDQVGDIGDQHDVSKLFLKGGADQTEEGIRGIIGSALPQKGAEKFINQMVRERTANRTFGMDRGSQTASLMAGEQRRNAILRAAIAIGHGLDPIHIVRSIGEYALSKSAAARDAELGRLLSISTQDPTGMLNLLNEISRTSPAHANSLRPLIDQVTQLAQRTVVPGMAGALQEPHTQRRHGIASPPPL